MSRVLVAGGAGYIGSITVSLLDEAGYSVTVFDNFSTGHKHNIPQNVNVVEGDLRDQSAVDQLFSDERFDLVINFAAKIQVGESIQEPRIYFENNVLGATNLIDAAANHGVQGFLFSSTAAVYGDPERSPISESDPRIPINPYGVGKYLVEQVLQSYENTHNLPWCALRYFNAAGAHNGIGPDYPFTTHLIPIAIDKLLEEKPLEIFGSDYKTRDGTCVRDYVHVYDIALAHVYAAESMLQSKILNKAINLGRGQGFSVFEVVKTLENITGKDVPYQIAPRREGDPGCLVASNELARQELDWKPIKSLENIVKDALEWRKLTI
jgi:UDP-glucose 4-epimerase